MTKWPMQVIACAMQKGGVGKTTTSINIAAALAQRGLRVCLVDVDGQLNTTRAMNIDFEEHTAAKKKTVLNIYAEALDAIDAVFPVEGRFDGRVSIIPGHKGLTSLFPKLEVGLMNQALEENLSYEDQEDMRREAADRLRESLKSLQGEFDAVVIDTPPALGFLLSTALRATDWLIIPMEPSELAVDGLRDLMMTVNKIKQRANPRLRLFRVLLGKFDGRKVLHRQIQEDLGVSFGDKLSQTAISFGVPVEELHSHKLSIFEHAPESVQAPQFIAIADELIEDVEAFLRRRAERMAEPNGANSASTEA